MAAITSLRRPSEKFGTYPNNLVEREGLFESVPNFSEGRRNDVIAAIAGAPAAHVLDVDADPDHHRVVISLAAERARLVDGLLAAVGAAVERIDVRAHSGVHPRVGAADVVPIVPLGGSTLAGRRAAAPQGGHPIFSAPRAARALAR